MATTTVATRNFEDTNDGCHPPPDAPVPDAFLEQAKTTKVENLDLIFFATLCKESLFSSLASLKIFL